MRTPLLTIMLILITVSLSIAQSIPPDSLYLGQTPPGNTPQMFAPGIISLPDRNEAVITFSPDGTTIFFYIEKWPAPGNPYTMYTTYADGHWSVPDTIPFTVGRRTGEPFFAYNGNRLYLFASNAVNHQGVVDLSYSEKQGDSWSNPVSMGDPPNSESYQYHPCIVGDTSVYFSSYAGHICRSQYSNGIYQNRVILPHPVNYTGTQTWGDPYVSPDESYMIFKSIREEGFGQNDLNITHRKPDNSWTNPKNLGNIINTPNDETSGDITSDGLYMTYGSNKDLYWVSSGFTDSLRYTNYIPYVKNPVPDQTSNMGELFTFTMPDSTFMDDDGNNTLSYHAMLSDGNPLPGWLSFDTIAATFSGIPDSIQTLDIMISAIDTAGAFATTTFEIEVEDPTSVDQPEEHSLSIFPNPTNGLVCISTYNATGDLIIAEVFNLMGEDLLSTTFRNSTELNLADKPGGLYLLKFQIGDKIIIRKIIKT